MKRLFFTFFISVLPIIGFGQNMDLNQKLPVDTTIKTGKLANGMSYFIKHFSNPKMRGEFYIVHNVGAMQEEDDQNGLAHFLEHMAFNGTRNFPGKSMLDYLGKIGVRFGYNVNAYTSKERTVYNISNVPLIRSTIIDSVLLALHDWSYFISCEPQEIDKERGVIREEWRLGDNPRNNMLRKAGEFQYKGSKYPERTVIGDTAVINNFVPATLVSFYHKWYRPDMQAIVLVGDFDVNDMESRVKKVFSSIPKAVNPEPKGVYTVPDNKEPIIGVVTDPETNVSSLKLFFKINGPTQEQKLTEEPIYNSILSDLIISIFKTKLDTARDGENSPFKTAVAVFLPGNANLDFVQFTVSTVDDDYLKALKGLLIETERAKKFGFSQQELDLAKKVLAKKIDSDLINLDKRKNADFVSPIIEHFTNGEALTPYNYRKEEEKEILESVTIVDINNYLVKLFPDHNRIVLVSAPESDKDKLPSEQALSEVMANIGQYEIKPYDNATQDKELAPDLKLAGSPVVKQKEWGKYGFKEWTLKNGIKVYLYQRSEPNSKVSLSAFSKGGVCYVDEKDLSSARLLDAAMRGKGLANMNDKELKTYLAGKNANIFTDIGLNSETVIGTSSKIDAETLLKLLYLNFTSVTLNEDTYKKTLDRQRESLEKTKGSKEMIYRDSVITFEYQNNPYKRSLLRISDLDKANLETIQKIYNERFANGNDFVFFLMGPQSESEIKPLVEKYIGSLPTAKGKETYKDRGISIRKGVKEFSYYNDSMSTPRSKISILYSGDMDYNLKNRQTLMLLEYLLSDRYLNSIREEKGGAYNVGVYADLISTPKNRVELLVDFETDPKLRDELLEIVQKEIDDVVTNGPKESEIKDAVLYIKKNFKDKEKDGDYWFNRFRNFILEGVDIQDGEEQSIDKISTKDIQKLASDLFGQGNKLTFIYGTK
ncbi:MAG: insulinase family protein [Bacteroidales bacterium]